jgi:hypothetical protein
MGFSPGRTVSPGLKPFLIRYGFTGLKPGASTTTLGGIRDEV